MHIVFTSFDNIHPLADFSDYSYLRFDLFGVGLEITSNTVMIGVLDTGIRLVNHYNFAAATGLLDLELERSLNSNLVRQSDFARIGIECQNFVRKNLPKSYEKDIVNWRICRRKNLDDPTVQVMIPEWNRKPFIQTPVINQVRGTDNGN